MTEAQEKNPILKKIWIGLLIMIFLTPLGILAKGTAFGEWGTEEIKKLVGYVPSGLARFGNFSMALLPEYSIKGSKSGFLYYFGYLLSALLGVVVIVGLSYVLGKMISGSVENKRNDDLKKKN
jgi:cobalt/nickel transport protein